MRSLYLVPPSPPVDETVVFYKSVVDTGGVSTTRCVNDKGGGGGTLCLNAFSEALGHSGSSEVSEVLKLSYGLPEVPL